MQFKKFHILTFGCKLNIYESESISNILQISGCLLSKNIENSDLIIINTCTVTVKSDAKCRNAIRKAKKISPDSIIIVCGCLVNTDINELSLMHEVDIFIENKNKDKIVDILNIFHNPTQRIKPFIFKSNQDGSFNFQTFNMSNHSRAFVKIQDGCNNYCSYCKIPFARGDSRSRGIDDIVNEINNIIDNGYEEIVLTGINIGSYSCNKFNFNKLLLFISEKYKNTRFRISSLELQYIDDFFLDIFSKKNICAHSHIPLQSGSNKILNLMNRNYNTNSYHQLVQKLRKFKENLFLSTDLILGFPDESEIDFDDTMKFIMEIDFSFIHLFGFSPRKGTKAYSLVPKIPERVRDKRFSILRQINKESNLRYREKFLNKSLEVVIETKKNTYYTGKSDNYIDITIDSKNKLLSKKKYLVKLNKIENTTNYGILVN